MRTSADGGTAEGDHPTPRPFFHGGVRAWQDHFDSRTMFFLATADEAGRPD